VRWPLVRVKVAERSMEPALLPGDWLVVRRSRRIRPGQIVLARHPGRPEMLIVKRAERRVAGGWWLASDNPGAGAVDSRRFGAVPQALIVGRVLGRYWRENPLARTAPVRGYPGKAGWPRRGAGPSKRGAVISGGRRSPAARSPRTAGSPR
jgi:nickel-type superoxide dismutase maturation protease